MVARREEGREEEGGKRGEGGAEKREERREGEKREEERRTEKRRDKREEKEGGEKRETRRRREERQWRHVVTHTEVVLTNMYYHTAGVTISVLLGVDIYRYFRLSINGHLLRLSLRRWGKVSPLRARGNFSRRLELRFSLVRLGRAEREGMSEIWGRGGRGWGEGLIHSHCSPLAVRQTQID